MHKETGSTRALFYRRAAIGVLLFAGLICFAVAHARPTSASLAIVRFGTNRGSPFVVLQLSNAGPATISYFGYDTNQPWYSFQIQTPVGPTNFNQFFCGTGLQELELKPRHCVDFQVWMSDQYQNYRVALNYDIPKPSDWFRYHAPYQIARWFPRPRPRTALSPLIKTNSQLTAAN
jgi:hypothetical protein